MLPCKKRPPEEVGSLQGAAFAVAGLLSLAVPVKPSANEMGNYACSDRHNQIGEVFHCSTSFCRLYVGGDSTAIIPNSDRGSKRRSRLTDRRGPDILLSRRGGERCGL